MMGPTHAMSGAAAWLAGSWALGEFMNIHQRPAELVVGAAVCAGAALLPDLDCSGRVTANKGGATVARTFGVASLFLAECVEKFALAVYTVTRAKHDPKRKNGHRTLTHTWVFNVALGGLVAFLAGHWGKPFVIGLLFFTLGLAIRGLLADWAKERGWIVVTLLSAGAAYGAWLWLPADRGFPLLGLAIAFGGVIHTLGDMITRAGCPVLWPLPLAGRVWREIGVPNFMAVQVNGGFERGFLRPFFVIVAGLAGILLAVPDILDHLR
ncbi:metal-dependent hydrolase [Longispora sp. NPDC051575]|uniref:metal-dependent hydrolase n=1 Tax=Longispora sp. NPDC051575 TaxID=3154943 RepID=UPI00342F9E36